MNAEQQRLAEADAGRAWWRKWGPYLADRQWGTVREDYSPSGDAWEYFPHDHARSRAYRWGEDGLGGICDDRQRLCLGVALWNGRDPFLKERPFGLTNAEGNHGEDVKEVYHHLDSTPTHSYLKFLYKYPQGPFPYHRLLDENRRRTRLEPEYELADTGVFAGGRYFDVVVEYAKASPMDVLWRVTAHNRGPAPADLHVLLQAWYRNTWSWVDAAHRPVVSAVGPASVRCDHPIWLDFRLALDGTPELLFCDNDTNAPKLFGVPTAGYFKDGFHERIVNGKASAVNPARTGTKAAGWYRLSVPAGGSVTVRGRLSLDADAPAEPFADFDAVFAARLAEADEFYADLQKGMTDADARAVQRQAFAGLLWTKQYYGYDVRLWSEGDPAQPPPPPGRDLIRNGDWPHLVNAEVVSMPDKWEYPWYAAWDLAFHMVPFALVDPEFAKSQLVQLTREWYMHPNGQLPAYEWNFSDVNPPVHAWAAWRVFQIDRKRSGGVGDLAFLERVFHKLTLNFTWWVNRKDAEGRNVFQGGFLGLDNIGVFDRSKPLPTGGYINQSDGTAWMAAYALHMLRIALELALHNRVYEDLASKFFEHFLHIAEAMADFCGKGRGLWDEADGFYYDQLVLPDGRTETLRLRSLVGLIPLCAVETLEPDLLARVPGFTRRMEWLLNARPDLAALVSRWTEPGLGERRLLSLLRGHRMKLVLRRMLDEAEFLSPHGVRSLSKAHGDHPYVFAANGVDLTVRYTPGESDTWLFGGNSNWRGPVWLPVNYLLIESLQKFHHYYGPDFRVEHPTGSGNKLSLEEIADDLSARVCGLFLRGEDGRRPAHGTDEVAQSDPHFRDHLLFHEYFHGDTGAGLGAAHQTGWTALAAKLLMPRRPDPVQHLCAVPAARVGST
ncbi:MAG: glucosidase [Gemmataceae bacterium]|nr:glucosidase [Gemmataceae bacterium]